RAPADHQLPDARPGVRPGLHPEHGPREAGQPRAEQQLRLRRPEHLADRQPVRGVGGAAGASEGTGEPQAPARGLFVRQPRRSRSGFARNSPARTPRHDTRDAHHGGRPVVFWFWVGLAILALPPVAFGLLLAAMYLYVRWKYMGFLVRIFQE